ncbi:MAG: hypothetical protein KatS3mg110_1502 [Pirellulaceae bacterium]|nr:MAG: hypothetical protein KatS3mg110_1502 [Pirellulaceae bacterium]
MAQQATAFELVRNALRSGGIPAALEQLENQLRLERKYHELFEVLKMRARHRAGLPLLYTDPPDPMPDEQRQLLEDGLLAACREVGLLLLESGAVREGWIYLRPVGDMRLAREALARVAVTDANVDELVEVLLHEGVDTERGFRLVLEKYGTCSAITSYDTVVAQRSKKERQQAAALLVEQLHRELLESLRHDIQRQQGVMPSETTIAELVADRDWLFGEFAYHVDTTHLASVMRCARVLDDRRHVELARDMAEYGLRLSPQFQYRSEEPFAETYPAHALWFDALLGRRVDEALDYFRRKAEELSVDQHGALPRETWIDLLVRVGRPAEALREALRLLPEAGPTTGVAPSLWELGELAGDFGPIIDYYRQAGNLLGYATGLLCAETRGDGK